MRSGHQRRPKNGHIDLPTDILVDILRFCDRPLLNKCLRLVNKQFMKICNKHIHSITIFPVLFVTTRPKLRSRLSTCSPMTYCLPMNWWESEQRDQARHKICNTHTKFKLPCNTSMKFSEFEKFISSNRSVRFQSVRFDNVQRGCVIEFFKKILETTEAFDSDSFYVKFEHEIFAIKTIHGVLHVPASYVDLDKANRRKVNLDEFVPGKGHSIKNLRNYRVLSKKCCGNFD